MQTSVNRTPDQRIRIARDVSVVLTRKRARHCVLCPEMCLTPGVHLLVGPNGCGKSMLCKALAGVIRAAGHIDLGMRRPLYVWQEQTLFPISVESNLRLVARNIPADRRHRQIENALSTFGLCDRRQFQPGQLSGGLLQRATLARAYVASVSREAIFFDEPTQETDLDLLDRFVEMIGEISEENPQTALVIVSHDHQLISAIRTFNPSLWTMLYLDDCPHHENPIKVTTVYLSGPFSLADAIAKPPTPFLARFLGYDNVFAISPGDSRSLHRLGATGARESNDVFCAIAAHELAVQQDKCADAVRVVRRRLSVGMAGAWIGFYEHDRGPGVPKVHLVVESAHENSLLPAGWLRLKDQCSLRELVVDSQTRQRAIDLRNRVNHG